MNINHQNKMNSDKNISSSNLIKTNMSNSNQSNSSSNIPKTTYLGKKGYTIMKKDLSLERQYEIRELLTAKPAKHIGLTSPTEYPVYRESDNKFYVPRYFGEKHFGNTPIVKLSDGLDINLEFCGEMRDYQLNVVNTYLDSVKSSTISEKYGGGGLIEIGCGKGKCLGANTPIRMYNGEIKLVQDIKVNDIILGDDCSPRHILSLSRGREMMYNIYYINMFENKNYVVNKSHVLSLIVVNPPVNNQNLIKELREKIPIYKLEILEDLIIGSFIDIELIEYMNLIKTYPLLKLIIKGYALPSISIYNNGKLENINDTTYYHYYFNSYESTRMYNQYIYRNYVSIFDIQITELKVDKYYGFEIDGNRRFVLGNFIVTHNTVCALNIISKIKKKTLVIVHKEFLMNQWIERIEQFLPTARVGKIQGQIADVDDKDIVLGMLQSLSMKEYKEEVFDGFGLTVIDEVHHISSEVFSNVLFKNVTKYTLGLSATMNRKDGTTPIFKMFLGEVVYKDVGASGHDVLVKAYEYKTDNEEFNHVETDFRGNVKYSTMISKLCEYTHRTEFIINIVKEIISEDFDNKQQIMIIAHNKNVLKYIHDAIEFRKIATVGYYVGGMKEAALKESETKKVIIATYSMAAEALDIKTLTCLVMVTPKTDIEQAVGRILRAKHSTPLVIDIIDQHTPFQNQWNKRRLFYIKQNYKIIKTCHMTLPIPESKWQTLYDPNDLHSGSKNGKKRDLVPIGKCMIKTKK
jgi:hypothetical protein